LAKRAIALLFLAAAVSAGLLYYLRRGTRAAQSSTIPDLITLVPPEAPYLIYADLAALRSSPFLASLMASVPAPAVDKEYAQFVRATGFEYTRDLDRVVLALIPKLPANQTVALVEGRFDQQKITSFALLTGKLEHQDGAEVYVLPATTNSGAASFAFLDANRMALTDGPRLAVLPPRASGGLAPDMRERISRVAGSALFAVGKVGPVPENFAPGGLRSEQFTHLMHSVRWFTLAVRPEGDRMRVALEAECDTPENARQMAGTLDGLRLLGQASLSDANTRKRLEPEALRLLDSLLRIVEVSRDELRVRLALELTPEMLGSLPRMIAPKTPVTSPPLR